MRAGEVYVVAPGTIHCIGSDITLLEVQQPSDITYRVYDWNRQPPRPLHLKQARAVIDPALRPAAQTPVVLRGPEQAEGQLLVGEGPFRVERWRISASFRRMVTALTAVVTLDGQGTISAGGEAPRDLAKGDSCVVPRGATMLDLQGGARPLDVALVTPTD